MIDGLRPYPEMKQTGLPWLGDIPARWDVRRNGRLFGARRETGYPDLPVLQVSISRGVRIRDFDGGGRKQEMADRSKYQRAVRGDIAYNMMRMWQGAVGIAPADGLVSPAYVVARPFPGTDAGYYAYLFRTTAYMRETDVFSRGIVPDRNRLYWESFKQMPSVYPPLAEQRLIVRFLDWHGAQTAKLIRAKKKLIVLLNEQKQAVIHRAITRGFDPTAKLKPTGIPWLGDVPAHWEVKRLKWATRLQRGYDLPADKRVAGPHPVVSSGGVIDHHVEYKVRAPGVVMGRYGSTEAVFYIKEHYWPHNTSLFVTDFQANLPLWCYYLLRTISKADHSGKSAVPGVDRKDLFDIVVAVPGYAEQIEVVKGIEERSKKLNNAISTVEKEVTLILEFRLRLIADVVTGKLDVRSAATTLPEATDFKPAETLPDDEEAEFDLDQAETEELAA